MAAQLDIVIAASREATALVPCLEALQRELDNDAAGVTITVASAGSPASIAAAFPVINWIERDERAALPDLWGAALSGTTADIVAILDADCPVAPGWLRAALSVASEVTPEIGFASGAVVPRSLDSTVAWAAYFCDYGWFIPPLAQGPPMSVAGNNLLIHRTALRMAPQFAGRQFWKAHFIDALRRHNVRGIQAPGLTIWYQKNVRTRGWLSRRYRHARCYASMRTSDRPWTTRFVRGALAPLLPAVFYGRLVREVWPRKRYRGEFVSAAAWIWIGFVVWAAGEWHGYWFGDPAKACADTGH